MTNEEKERNSKNRILPLKEIGKIKSAFFDKLI